MVTERMLIPSFGVVSFETRSGARLLTIGTRKSSEPPSPAGNAAAENEQLELTMEVNPATVRKVVRRIKTVRVKKLPTGFNNPPKNLVAATQLADGSFACLYDVSQSDG